MKKVFVSIVFCVLTLSVCDANLFRGPEFRKMPHPLGREFVQEPKINYAEPNCDELRAMWRFSRRQSRASEVTNDVPTYRDPFSYNIWEKYPKSRSVVTPIRTPTRVWSRPIYGRVVENAPSHHPRVLQGDIPRIYEGIIRYREPDTEEDTRLGNHRLTPQPNRMSQAGSFQRLKELVWAERMRELQQQRLAEDSNPHNAAIHEPIQMHSMHFAKPYPGGSRTNYLDNYHQDKSTRLKLLTDHAYNYNNANNNENDGNMADDGVYTRPYNQRSMFINPPSNIEYW